MEFVEIFNIVFWTYLVAAGYWFYTVPKKYRTAYEALKERMNG